MSHGSSSLSAAETTTLRATCGAKAVHLLHGVGYSGNDSDGATAAATGADGSMADYLRRHNFGVYSDYHTASQLPAPPKAPGLVMADVLNLHAAARQRGGAVTWAPTLPSGAPSNVRLMLLDIGLDGMLLKSGAIVDEATLEAVGFTERVSAAEAGAFLALSESRQRRWRKEHPLVTEAVEVMGALSDSSVMGHLGYFFDAKAHKAPEVLQRISVEVVSLLRDVCERCLRWAFKTDSSWEEAIERCGLACVECLAAAAKATASEASVDAECETHCGHHTQRRCLPCQEAQVVCRRFHPQSVGVDVGGAALSAVRRATDRAEGDEAAAQLGDCEMHSDLIHDIKSGTRGTFNHLIRARGHLVGVAILQAMFYDGDLARRAAMRAVLTRRELRNKNPFSVEDQVALSARKVRRAVVTEGERVACEALRIVCLGPSRHKFWRENRPCLYDTPMGIEYHVRSGLVFYVDTARREVRVLKVSHTPCDNTVLISRGAGLVAPTAVALIGSTLYVADRGQHAVLCLEVKGVLGRYSAAADVSEQLEQQQRRRQEVGGEQQGRQDAQGRAQAAQGARREPRAAVRALRRRRGQAAIRDRPRRQGGLPAGARRKRARRSLPCGAAEAAAHRRRDRPRTAAARRRNWQQRAAAHLGARKRQRHMDEAEGARRARCTLLRRQHRAGGARPRAVRHRR